MTLDRSIGGDFGLSTVDGGRTTAGVLDDGAGHLLTPERMVRNVSALKVTRP